VRRTASGVAGIGLGTTIKYLRGAAGIGLGTTIRLSTVLSVCECSKYYFFI
jgi:hypothetical protein